MGRDGLKCVEWNHETHLFQYLLSVFRELYSTVSPSNLRLEILTRLMGLLPLDTLIVILASTFDPVLSDGVDKKRLKEKRAEE